VSANNIGKNDIPNFLGTIFVADMGEVFLLENTKNRCACLALRQKNGMENQSCIARIIQHSDEPQSNISN
jgi:hypothetical protein